MGRMNGFLSTFLIFFAVSLGISFGIFSLMLCRTTFDVLVVLVIIIGVSVLALFSGVIERKLAIRRAAMKALGMRARIAIQKDATARIAYKGIVKLMQNEYALAEELLMKAYNLSDVRNNQLFCIEWLIRLYEAVMDSPTAELDTNGKLLWCFRKSAELASDSPESQSRLGHAYYLDGKLTKAEYCFEQALKYDPNHGYSYFSLAKIYACRGEDEKAVETLEKLLTIQENHPLVFGELATIYAMHNDTEKCKEYYNKAVLCGIDKPERLAARITAIYDFNKSKDAASADLPNEYYRYIRVDDEEETEKHCSSSCPHCELRKNKVKDDENAGDE